MQTYTKPATYKIGTAMLLSLVMIAFAVKSMFPSGFMPVVDKDGYTQIVICSGMEERTISVPSDQAPAEEHKSERSKICSFMVLASAVSIPELPALTLPVDGGYISTVSFVSDVEAHTYFAIPFPPRGPPAV